MSQTRSKPPLGFVIAAIMIVLAAACLKYIMQRSALEDAAKEVFEKRAAEQRDLQNTDNAEPSDALTPPKE